jgi:hypothetical protein
MKSNSPFLPLYEMKAELKVIFQKLGEVNSKLSASERASLEDKGEQLIEAIKELSYELNNA